MISCELLIFFNAMHVQKISFNGSDVSFKNYGITMKKQKSLLYMDSLLSLISLLPHHIHAGTK